MAVVARAGRGERLIARVMLVLGIVGTAGALITGELGFLWVTAVFVVNGWRTQRVAIVVDGDDVAFRNIFRTRRFRRSSVVDVAARKRRTEPLNHRPAVQVAGGRWVFSDVANDFWDVSHMEDVLRLLHELKGPTDVPVRSGA